VTCQKLALHFRRHHFKKCALNQLFSYETSYIHLSVNSSLSNYTPAFSPLMPKTEHFFY